MFFKLCIADKVHVLFKKGSEVYQQTRDTCSMPDEPKYKQG